MTLTSVLGMVSCQDEDNFAPTTTDNKTTKSAITRSWVEDMKPVEDGRTTYMYLSVNGQTANMSEIQYEYGKGSKVIAETTATVNMLNDSVFTITPANAEFKSVEFRMKPNGSLFTADKRAFSPTKKPVKDYTFEVQSSYDILGNLSADYVGPTKPYPLAFAPSSNKLQTRALSGTVIDICKWLAEKAAMSAGSTVAKEIYRDLFESAEQREMEKISTQIETINEDLKKFMDMYENTTYENYLNIRSIDYVSALNNYSFPYIVRLRNCNPDDTDQIRKILQDWHDKGVGGTTADTYMLNFIDFLTKTTSQGNHMYDIYDIYAFNTTPWESMGYDFREELRNADLAVIGTNTVLSILYTKYTNDYDDKSRAEILNNLTAKVEVFNKYFNEHKVERHDDLAICQIPGAHFVMNRTLIERDYFNKPWFPNGTDWSTDERDPSTWDLGWGPKHLENYNRSMSSAELEAIKKYYANVDSINNLWDALTKDAKCSAPWAGKRTNATNYMVLQGDFRTDHDSYRDYFIYPQNSCNTSKGFDNAKNYIGSAYLKSSYYVFISFTEFTRWATYWDDHIWFITDITSRY